MAHQAQQEFFSSIKAKFPQSFSKVKVIDCGSVNINGSLRELFEDSEYLGVDIHAGPNVDQVSLIHELSFKAEFDTVVSGEMLEHDEYWEKSLKKMYEMLKPGGLLVISAGGEGRPEHGTRQSGDNWGTSPDYYRNITEADFAAVFDLAKDFSEHQIIYNDAAKDIYFYGIKSKPKAKKK